MKPRGVPAINGSGYNLERRPDDLAQIRFWSTPKRRAPTNDGCQKPAGDLIGDKSNQIDFGVVGLAEFGHP